MLLLMRTLAIISASAIATNALPALAEEIEARASSCTFTDATSVSASKAACPTIVLGNIAGPAGETLDLTGLKSGTQVIFEGTTTFGYSEWEGPLVSISGTSITVTGAAGSVLDGDGAGWWDGQGGNGGKDNPKFFYAHNLKSSTINRITIKDSPVQIFSINGAQGLVLSDITIDNSAGDNGDLGHNTDAFDVGSSSDVTIKGANVKNQDECLAINSGTGITFTNGTCSGGHGLSIGSVGGRDDNTVSNILIENSSITDSDNGVRIKTVSGATGSVSNITYKSITLSNIAKYGIVIQQDYENGSPTGEPTTGVPTTDLTVQDVTGDVASKGKDVYILCGQGSCSDWTWNGVDVTGGEKASCEGVPSGVSC